MKYDVIDALGFVQSSAHAMLEIIVASVLVTLAVALLTSVPAISPGARQWCWSAAALFPAFAFVVAVLGLAMVHPDTVARIPHAAVPVVDPLDGALETASRPVSKPSLVAAGGDRHVLPETPNLPGFAASASWLGIAAVVWFVVVLSGLFRIVVGVVRTRGLARAELRMPMLSFPEASSANVAVRVSPRTDVPIAIGLISRTIVIPPMLMGALLEGEVRSVAAHEVAHLVRRDDWGDLIERCACAIMWLNPCVHLAAAASRVWRERACDLWAAEHVGSRTFAEALWRSAQTLSGRRPRESALALSMGGSLTARVRALVRPSRVSRGWTASVTTAVVAVAAIFTAVVAQRAVALTPFHARSVITGSMLQNRAAFTVAKLHDGNVLVAGGLASRHKFLRSAELYDGVRGFFKATGPLPVAVAGAVGTVLRDGRVLFTGGTTRGGPTSDAEVFDPVRKQFAAVAPMNVPRAGHTATLLGDGSVLVAGGETAGRRVTGTAERFDPTTGRFIATHAMLRARTGQSATVLRDGRVLIAGGRDRGTTFASTELYDVATATFRMGPVMLYARSRHAAARMPDGSVLIAGGSSTGLWNGRLATAERYVPRLRRFVRVGMLQEARFDAVAGLIPLPNGDAMLVRGADQFEMYHHRTRDFTLIDGTGGTVHPFGAAILLDSCAVLVAGGLDATSGGQATAEAFRIE